MRAIPDVFTEDDYPIAWLSAARLRGELRQSGPAYVPSWSPDTARLRAQCIAWLMSSHHIIGGFSAAWVHGVCDWRWPLMLSYPKTGPRGRVKDPQERIYTRLSTDPELCLRYARILVTAPVQTAVELWLRRDGRARPSTDLVLTVTRLAQLERDWHDTLETISAESRLARTCEELSSLLETTIHRVPPVQHLPTRP